MQGETLQNTMPSTEETTFRDTLLKRCFGDLELSDLTSESEGQELNYYLILEFLRNPTAEQGAKAFCSNNTSFSLENMKYVTTFFNNEIDDRIRRINEIKKPIYTPEEKKVQIDHLEAVRENLSALERKIIQKIVGMIYDGDFVVKAVKAVKTMKEKKAQQNDSFVRFVEDIKNDNIPECKLQRVLRSKMWISYLSYCSSRGLEALTKVPFLTIAKETWELKKIMGEFFYMVHPDDANYDRK